MPPPTRRFYVKSHLFTTSETSITIVPNLLRSYLLSKPSGSLVKTRAKSFDPHGETSIVHGRSSVTPEHQIILQTLGDMWLCLSAAVIVASIIQSYYDYKGLK